MKKMILLIIAYTLVQAPAHALLFADVYVCKVTGNVVINDDYYKENFSDSIWKSTVEVEAWTEGLAESGAIDYFKTSAPAMLTIDEDSIVATCNKKD